MYLLFSSTTALQLPSVLKYSTVTNRWSIIQLLLSNVYFFVQYNTTDLEKLCIYDYATRRHKINS